MLFIHNCICPSISLSFRLISSSRGFAPGYDGCRLSQQQKFISDEVPFKIMAYQ
jgi:hypothetical protein